MTTARICPPRFAYLLSAQRVVGSTSRRLCRLGVGQAERLWEKAPFGVGVRLAPDDKISRDWESTAGTSVVSKRGELAKFDSARTTIHNLHKVCIGFGERLLARYSPLSRPLRSSGQRGCGEQQSRLGRRPPKPIAGVRLAGHWRDMQPRASPHRKDLRHPGSLR